MSLACINVQRSAQWYFSFHFAQIQLHSWFFSVKARSSSHGFLRQYWLGNHHFHMVSDHWILLPCWFIIFLLWFNIVVQFFRFDFSPFDSQFVISQLSFSINFQSDIPHFLGSQPSVLTSSSYYWLLIHCDWYRSINLDCWDSTNTNPWFQ